MEALDLVLLGRRLSKIGETVLRGGESPEQPTAAGLVLRDVFAHPDSAIGQIAARTGLPQSHVSETVAQLRERGVVASRPDPQDGRRTLVSVAPGHPDTVAQAGSASVDEALRTALGSAVGPKRGATLITALEELARLLEPAEPGPIVRQINQARRGEK